MSARDFTISRSTITGDYRIFSLRIKIIKKFFTLLVFSFVIITFGLLFQKIYSHNFDRNLIVSDFRFDINQLSMIANMIESIRLNDNKSNIEPFGSDGNPLAVNEINPQLRTALIKVADTNRDGLVSEKEISYLQIKKVDSDLYREKFKDLQCKFLSTDKNLHHYVIITEGEEKGTILYNGAYRFTDVKNKRYFGLDLYN